MDVLKFINSNAIRKHLKEINYQFNAIEVIWLINNAHDLSFDERKKAYYDIIDNFADMSYMNSFGLFDKLYKDTKV